MKNRFLRFAVLFLAVSFFFSSSQGFAEKKSSVKVKIKKKAEKIKTFPAFFEGSQWLNTPKLSLGFFTDKVTLVYFWDYNSINCIRELKVLKAWEEYYRPYRFQILWVHAPEFSVGADGKILQKAVERFGIKGPVLMDNQFKLWDALEIKSWPTKLLVNDKGEILSMQGGEGENFNMESKIRRALKTLDANSVLPPEVYTRNVESYNPEDCGEMTSETYLGYKKASWWGAKLGNKQWLAENETRMLLDKGDRSERGFFLEGLWTNRSEFLEHARDTEGLSDYAGLLYQGREVYSVAQAPEAGKAKETRVYVTRDDEPVPVGYRGPDLRSDENGETYFIVSSPRLYYLIQGEDSEMHELKLWTSAKGVRFYSFSFSNLCLADFEHR